MSDTKEESYYEGNNFFFHGDFNDKMLKELFHPMVKFITSKKKAKNKRTLNLYIHSNGGQVDVCNSFLSLVEQAKNNDIDVYTYVYSVAYSAASLLACSGSKGCRYISENAVHLVHFPRGQIGYFENNVDVARLSDYAKHWLGRCLYLYDQYATIPNLAEKIEHDHLFFYGRGIIKNGLADNLIA